MPAGWAQPNVGPQIRHRPSAGAVVAAVGLLLFVMSLFGLPWVEANGESVNFPDIREALADGVGPGGTSGDYLEFYSEWIWIVGLVLVTTAVVFSTIIVPTNPGVRAILGFLTLGFVGAVVMAIDKDGTSGPKTCGLLATLAVACLHGLAVQQLFYADDFGADPAYGVWAGFAGLAVVLVGCVMGTRTEHAAR